MRFAYVCADRGVPVFGNKGCSVHVQEFLTAACELGIQIDLFAANSGDLTKLAFARRTPEIRIQALPSSPAHNREQREKAAFHSNQGIRETLHSAGPFDCIYERYSLWSFAAMEYARQIGIPGLLEVNAPLIEEQQAHRGLIDRDGAESVAARVFEAATKIVAVSAEVAKYLQKRFVPKEKIVVVPNAVNPSRFPVPPSLPAAAGIFTIGFLGSLKPWHGLSVLAEAFHLLVRKDRDCRLLVVGDGPQRSQLEADLKRLGVFSSVTFSGAVPPEEVPGLLASMDIGVAPYAEEQNFYFSPLKVYEYMAAGLAVVASRVGQIEEVLQHESSGLLCSPGNVIELVEAMIRLKEDHEFRSKMGEKARLSVLAEHTWKKRVQQILECVSIPEQDASIEVYS